MASLLSAESVTDAAVALVERHGWDALSLRAVAGRLGVTPMALYRHVADSDALAAAALEAIVAAGAEVHTGGALAHDLADWARRFHRDLGRYPGVAGWLLTHWFDSPAMLERIDALLELVGEHGIEGFHAVAVTNAVFMYVLMRCEAERQVRSAGVVTRRLRVAASDRPLTTLRSLANHYATAELDEHFEFGLRALIDGMHLPATPPKGRR